MTLRTEKDMRLKFSSFHCIMRQLRKLIKVILINFNGILFQKFNKKVCKYLNIKINWFIKHVELNFKWNQSYFSRVSNVSRGSNSLILPLNGLSLNMYIKPMQEKPQTVSYISLSFIFHRPKIVPLSICFKKKCF